jgi:hypothetical protein
MKTITALKSRLSSSNTLIVQSENAFVSEVGFFWNPPVSEDDLSRAVTKYNLVLPESYVNFLRISNGAELFKDLKYGQWGCQLLSLQEILETKAYYNQENPDFLNSYQYVFAKWIGDSDVTIFDTSKTENYIIDIQECDKVEESIIFKWDFEKWLDRYIVAQGAKYWQWYFGA